MLPPRGSDKFRDGLLMPLACPDCACPMPETAAFCPFCGRRMPKLPPPSPGKAGVLRDHFAGALAYITFIPAIVFLLLARYRQNRFVRFHAVQCLLFWGTGIIVALALRVASLLVILIPAAGPLFVVLMWMVPTIAALLLWFVLIAKAIQGEEFRLPLLGEFAAEYAGRP